MHSDSFFLLLGRPVFPVCDGVGDLFLFFLRIACCRVPSTASKSNTKKDKVAGTSISEGCVEQQQQVGSSSRGGGSGKAHEPSSGKKTASSASASAAGAAMMYQPAVVVHPDLEHFFTMFWYCYKIEHVVRHMARCWVEDNCPAGFGKQPAAASRGSDAAPATKKKGTAAARELDDDDDGGETGASTALGKPEDGGDEAKGAAAPGSSDNDDDERSNQGEDDSDSEVQRLCEQFSTQQAKVIVEMHGMIEHAMSHVVESIYGHPSMRKMNDGVLVMPVTTAAAAATKQAEAAGSLLTEGPVVKIPPLHPHQASKVVAAHKRKRAAAALSDDEG